MTQMVKIRHSPESNTVGAKLKETRTSLILNNILYVIDISITDRLCTYNNGYDGTSNIYKETQLIIFFCMIFILPTGIVICVLQVK